jgi:DNA mismatch repair ATPase MutS
MLPLQSFYNDQANLYSQKADALKKTISRISVFRLISFLLAVLFIYFHFTKTGNVFLLTAFIILIVFSILVSTSLKLKKQLALYEKLLFINANENNILQSKPNQFDNGQNFLIAGSYFDDLDVFGQSSLYHLLNRTTTQHGSSQLAGLLSKGILSKENIERYQQAVQSLSPQTEKRQLLTANGLLYVEEKTSLNSIMDWLKTESRITHQLWWKIIRWILPAFNLFAFFYYLATDELKFLLYGGSAALLLTAIFIKYINEQHQLIAKKQEILDQYAAILNVFNTVDCGTSEELKKLHETTVVAVRAIKQLARLTAFFDQRLNLLVALFFNSIFLYDLQILSTLEDWKENYKEKFDEWIHCVGEIECLNSFATFAFNNPDYTYPLVSTGELVIEAKAAAHPLIHAGERITNDFAIGKTDKLQLVTGSNMSGKTTFLRTIGVNILLAQCGAPVCASSFLFFPMHIFSSIRISDSLQEHTSYFMAELKRLQQIILQLQNGEQALVLIDEILRGTNSEDKTHGSEQFIRKLLNYNCLSLFATHDLALSSLENEFPQKISNWCFESVIENDTLHFDYKLQRGVAKNKNASFLMKKMDII